MTCKHDYFDIQCRAIKREIPLEYAVQCRITCADCGRAFRFSMIEDVSGNDFNVMATRDNGITLHAPIEPCDRDGWG